MSTSRRSSLSTLTAFVVALAVMYTPVAAVAAGDPQEQPRTVTTTRKPITSRSSVQLSPLASQKLSQHNRLMQSFGQLKSVQLRPGNVEDIQSAIRKLEGVASGDSAYGKMVSVASQEASFKQGVEAAAEREGSQKLADRLNANPDAVLQISGASAASKQVKLQLARDAKVLEDVGSKLEAASLRKQAALELPAPDGSFVVADGSWVEQWLDPAYAPTGVEEAILIAALVTAAVLLINAYAEAKGEDFQDREERTDTRSDFAKCNDRATSKRDKCLRDNKGNPFGEAGCWAQWSLETGICWTFPQ